MKPVPWRSVHIDRSQLPELLEAVRDHEGDNAACQLGHYWKARRGPEMLKALEQSTQLPQGFVGNGWPEAGRVQTWAAQQDQYELVELFDPEDFHTRDGGDAVYQAGALLRRTKKERPLIVDIGAGYGRLGFPLAASGLARYVAVDYSPIGLLTAPQFLSQTLQKPVPDWRTPDTAADAASLPAWALDEIADGSVDAFVSVHSFQEMVEETVGFYANWINRKAAPGAVLYSVNIGNHTVPARAVMVSNAPYPINRDGSFNERIFELP